ncbi:MAG TPA: hypothetical protein PK781_01560 [Terrimesophilobacter sp.]|nr:hypothetical protein [Terrimesophilobacter sp.]HRP99128.1 hypothetical protein [Terrimesophilobacter sp.]
MTTITIRIHRVQTTTIEMDQPFDPNGDLDRQLDDTGAWGVLSARLHEDSNVLSISLLPAPIPAYPGDPYVIVEGGLVQNDPLLPVFDLDILKTSFITDDDILYARDLADRARDYGLTDLAARVDRFLSDD